MFVCNVCIQQVYKNNYYYRTLDEEVSRNLELSRAEKGITFTAYHRYGEVSVPSNILFAKY